MSESLNNAEKEYASVEDLLGMHRSVSNETAFFLRFQTYLMRKMLLLHQDKEKTFNFKQKFPYLLPKSKSGYNVSRDVLINPARYFNQRFLNFNQQFASDADYLFFLRFVYG